MPRCSNTTALSRCPAGRTRRISKARSSRRSAIRKRRRLKGRRFESIDEQNAFLAHWNERWAATRIHGTTKRQVRAMFEEERPFLLPLPATRFEYYRICERTVHFDGYIEVDSAYYSAPPRYVGRKVVVHVGRLWLRILDPKTHECLREFPIATHKGSGARTTPIGPNKRRLKVENLAARIAGAGPGCGAFARRLVEERGAVALRALFGMLDLLRRYEAAAVDTRARSPRRRALRAAFRAHVSGPSRTPTKLKTEHRIIPEIETYTTHFTTLTQGATS